MRISSPIGSVGHPWLNPRIPCLGYLVFDPAWLARLGSRLRKTLYRCQRRDARIGARMRHGTLRDAWTAPPTAETDAHLSLARSAFDVCRPLCYTLPRRGER